MMADDLSRNTSFPADERRTQSLRKSFEPGARNFVQRASSRASRKPPAGRRVKIGWMRELAGCYDWPMKLLGFGLLLAGWAITVAAVALLGGAVRTIFVLAGVGVEALGLALAIRGHLGGRGEEA